MRRPRSGQVTGASIAGSQAAIEEMIGPRLIGRDPDDLNANCAIVAKAVVANEAAKAAVDVALHDLAARRLGIPLPRLLGAAARQRGRRGAAGRAHAGAHGCDAGGR